MRVAFALDPHFSSHSPVSRKDDFQAAMLAKLRFLAGCAASEQWDAFVIAGDVFASANVSFDLLVALVRTLKLFGEAGCDVLAIAGNHDLKYRRLDSISQTPFGMLVEAGLITDLEALGGYGQIVGMHYRDRCESWPKCVVEAVADAPTPRVLVCHQYVGREPSGFEALASGWLLYDAIDALDLSVVVAGHDHVPHPVAVTPGGTIVYRFGSLSRGTKHEHNLSRIPCVLVGELDEGRIPAFEFLEIPCAEDVFRETALVATAHDAGVRNFVRALGSDAFRPEAGGRATASEVLVEMATELGIEPAVVERVRAYFDTYGIV